MTLVDTETAAVAAGVKASSFRQWASRRELQPARVQRVGRANTRWWDLDQVYDAQGRRPKPRRHGE